MFLVRLARALRIPAKEEQVAADTVGAGVAAEAATGAAGLEVLETREWLDSLDYVLAKGGPERAGRLLQQLALHAWARVELQRMT